MVPRMESHRVMIEQLVPLFRTEFIGNIDAATTRFRHMSAACMRGWGLEAM